MSESPPACCRRRSTQRRVPARTGAPGSRPALCVRMARGDAAFHEPDVRRLALLVRLAPADGDQHPVAGGRVGDVGPPEGAHLAPPHPRHEEEPGDHGVEVAALEGDLLGLDAAAGGRWRGRPRGLPPRTAAPVPGLDRRRSAGSRRGPGPSVPPARLGSPARRARKHAAATVVAALAGARPWSWSSAR